jgi:hypothetical protein
VWREEVERFVPRSRGRVAAERERKTLEATGLSVSMLLRCDAERHRGRGATSEQVWPDSGPNVRAATPAFIE